MNSSNKRLNRAKRKQKKQLPEEVRRELRKGRYNDDNLFRANRNSEFRLPVDLLEKLALSGELRRYKDESDMLLPHHIFGGTCDAGGFIDMQGMSSARLMEMLRQGKRNIRLISLPPNALTIMVYILLWKNNKGMGKRELIAALKEGQEMVRRELEEAKRDGAEENNRSGKNNNRPKRKRAAKTLREPESGGLGRPYGEDIFGGYIEFLANSYFIIREGERFRLHKMYLYTRSQVKRMQITTCSNSVISYEDWAGFFPFQLHAIEQVRGREWENRCSPTLFPEELFSDIDAIKFFCKKAFAFIDMADVLLFKKRDSETDAIHEIPGTNFAHNLGALTLGEMLFLGEYYKLDEGAKEPKRHERTIGLLNMLVKSGWLIEKKVKERWTRSMIYDYIAPHKFHTVDRMYACYEPGLAFREEYEMDGSDAEYKDYAEAVIKSAHPKRLPVAFLLGEFLDYVEKKEDFVKTSTRGQRLEDCGIMLDICAKKFGLKSRDMELDILGKKRTAMVKTDKEMAGKAPEEMRKAYFFNDEQFGNRKGFELSLYAQDALKLIGGSGLEEGMAPDILGKDLWEYLKKEHGKKLLFRQGNVFLKAGLRRVLMRGEIGNLALGSGHAEGFMQYVKERKVSDKKVEKQNARAVVIQSLAAGWQLAIDARVANILRKVDQGADIHKAEKNLDGILNAEVAIGRDGVAGIKTRVIGALGKQGGEAFSDVIRQLAKGKLIRLRGGGQNIRGIVITKKFSDEYLQERIAAMKMVLRSKAGSHSEKFSEDYWKEIFKRK